jgi:hypothetical protein
MPSKHEKQRLDEAAQQSPPFMDEFMRLFGQRLWEYLHDPDWMPPPRGSPIVE